MAEARAVVVTSVLPYPVISGGHKRTLRLIETIARAGLTPHVLCQQAATPEAIEPLRSRGWVVETIPSPSPTTRARLSQHLARRPSPFLPQIAARVRQLAGSATVVQLEHAQNAYYLHAAATTRTVLSLHNVDSQMIASVARASRGLTRLKLTNRAHATMVTERRFAPQADAVITVCDADRRHFESMARHVLEAPNGVDDEFFTMPDRLIDTENIVFFGNFDHLPNVLGVQRFLREGWPRLAAQRPASTLTLIGRDAPASLTNLANRLPRVTVAGFVEDLPATLSAARVVLIPLWQGGGTRLKVLESLAAARPIAATSIGVEGIGVRDGDHALLADTPADLVTATERLLDDEALALAVAGRGRALAERYRWPRALAAVQELYESWR